MAVPVLTGVLLLLFSGFVLLRLLRSVRRGLSIPDAMQWAIDTLEDDYMLASAGVTSDLDAVEARLRAWLEPFEDVKPIPSAR